MSAEAIKSAIALAVALALALSVYFYGERQYSRGFSVADAAASLREKEALASSLEDTKRLSEKIKGAEDAAKKMENEIRERDARIANLYKRVRESDAALQRSLASASCEAIRAAASAIDTLFRECRDEYAAMGRNAARHYSDVRTLVDAWPE